MLHLYRSDFLSICYDGYAHTIETRWLAMPPSTYLRQTLLTALELAQEYHARAWLSNQQHVRPFSAEDYQWVCTEWLSKFMALDVTHMAIVQSNSRRVRSGMIDMMQRAEIQAPLSCGYFETRDAARRWILSGQQIAPQHSALLGVSQATPITMGKTASPPVALGLPRDVRKVL